MISFEEWNKAVDDADTFYDKKVIRVTEVDGTVFEGLCGGYVEDEDSNENACWAIIVGWRKYLQENVEKIEFL